MVQVDLNGHSTDSIKVSRKVYTMEDVDGMCKIWRKSNQLGLDGWAFCTYKNLTEVEWVKAAILDALNNPETFNATDNYGALCNLKAMIKGKNAIVLRDKYGVPQKLEYRNVMGINSIVDANHDDCVIIPVTAEEILDLIADINKNHKLEDIFDAYNFYHVDMTLEKMELFKKYYNQGKLNKIIRYICSKSNELGGFHDYGVDTIRNRLTTQYLFDSRRGDCK